MYLHHPQTRAVQAMLREGKIGQVQLITSWFSFYLSPENTTNIRLNPDLGGGSLWDVGVYPTSMAVAMAGAAPEEVWAQQTIGETGVDVDASGTDAVRQRCSGPDRLQLPHALPLGHGDRR